MTSQVPYKKRTPRADTANRSGLEEHVPTLASIFATRLRRIASRHYRRLFNLGVVEWRIIMCLGAHPNIAALEISQITDINKGLVSRTIAEMERRGWVQTNRISVRSRSTTILLTDEGDALYLRLKDAVAERHRLVMSPLTTEESETLVRLMQKLIAHIDTLDHPSEDE